MGVDMERLKYLLNHILIDRISAPIKNELLKYIKDGGHADFYDFLKHVLAPAKALPPPPLPPAMTHGSDQTLGPWFAEIYKHGIEVFELTDNPQMLYEFIAPTHLGGTNRHRTWETLTEPQRRTVSVISGAWSRYKRKHGLP